VVAINGVLQIPTTAYSVSGTTLTFTEAPAVGDLIDVRRLTTTATVTQIASTNGFMQLSVDNNGIYIGTGTVGLATSGYITLGTETIYYTYVDGYDLGGCFRAQNNTTAAAHTAGVAVYVPNLPRITVWPTPDGAQTYQFVYWRMRRVQDAGNGVNVMDVPFRFVPCMVAGLAYYVALKVPGGMERLQVLKAQYDEAWMTAADEDQERAALRLVPRQMFIGGG
jgi:hypothetical protein